MTRSDAMIEASTLEVAEGERFAYWREVLTARFLPLEPERVGSAPFEGSIRGTTLGDLPLTAVSAGGQRVHRGRRLDDHPPVYFLNLQLAGAGGYDQADGGAVRGGDLFVIDSSRPFRLHCHDRLEQISLTVPRAVLDRVLSHPERAGGARIPASHPLATLLRSQLVAAVDLDRSLAEPVREAMRRYVVELLTAALNEEDPSRPAPREVVRESLHRAALRRIGLELGDPALSAGSIARRLGVSERTLQRIFAERGESLMRTVWRMRVEAAERALADRALADRSITEIALACGFGDASHFSRVFRARTGRSPREWRRAPSSRPSRDED